MPPASHSDYIAMSYFCDCSVRCKRRKQVSRTTYYDHAKFRNPQLRPYEDLDEDYNTFAALHGVSSTVTSVTTPSFSSESGSFIGPSHKRRRLQPFEEENGNNGEHSGGTQEHIGQPEIDSASGGREYCNSPAGYLAHCDSFLPDPNDQCEDGSDRAAGSDSGGQVHCLSRSFF